MVYTPDSSFLSAPTGNARAWADAIRAHNAADADALAQAYFTYGAQIGINADLALAQMCHETGWATSAHYLNQRNMAGLGVTGPNVEGPTFATIDDGVKAHYEHLVCYTMDADPPVMRQWGMLDPRHAFHDGLPRIADLERLPQRGWANPGTGYVASIVAIANQVAGGSTPVADYPTAADIGCPVRIETTDFVGPDRPLSDVRWWVQHDIEGGYESGIAVLTHGSRSGSVHFIIGKNPGEFCASVPVRTTAWTPGNDIVAAQSVNVEMAGFADAHDGGYTDWQYAATAAAFRWCVAQGMVNCPAVYIGRRDADGGPEPDVPGILGHQDVPDGRGGWGGASHHTDPGPHWDWDRMIAAIGSAPAPPAPQPHVVDGQTLGDGFWAAYSAVPTDNDLRARLYGRCLEGDHDEYLRTPEGATVPVVAARFERQVLIWDRGATAAPWDVRAPLATERVLRKPPPPPLPRPKKGR